MKLSDFDYQLPTELIAQYPLKKRDDSRLLVVHRQTGEIKHSFFKDISHHLPTKSLFIINNSKVIPARLLGKKRKSGGRVEVFLLKSIDEKKFQVMLKPLKKIKEQEILEFPQGLLGRLIDREKCIVEFEGEDVYSRIEKIGHMPLPPYIHRLDENSDRETYQTIYAKIKGSVAAPTAGLHFTEELMTSLKQRGHCFAEVTLHVNQGTFKPVDVENILDHPMHSESYEMTQDVVDMIRQKKLLKHPIVAVGTTSCRTLESFAKTNLLKAETKLFLYPGASFKMVDILITNFHLPKSTLLMLVSAFAGTDLIKKAYQEAIKEKYRFYSYGDAMMII